MVDEVKIRRLAGIWMATSFLSIRLLLNSVTGITYLFFEKVDVKGKTININVKYYIQMNIYKVYKFDYSNFLHCLDHFTH